MPAKMLKSSSWQILTAIAVFLNSICYIYYNTHRYDCQYTILKKILTF